MGISALDQKDIGGHGKTRFIGCGCLEMAKRVQVVERCVQTYFLHEFAQKSGCRAFLWLDLASGLHEGRGSPFTNEKR